jgi:proline iminopeptidase
MKDYQEEYIDINGVKQYFLHYPSESDYVILNLHGGPGQSEAQLAYYTKDERLKCSVVYYDQRGTGKTQLKNRTRPENITLDILIEDLKQTIQYLKEKYNTEKVIVLGHSWGSVLGTYYVKKNPHDVVCFIGTGQVIDTLKNEKVGYDKLEEMIIEKSNAKHIKVLRKHKGYPYETSKESFTKTLMSIRKLQGKYGLMGDLKKAFKVFFKSPVFHLTDLYALAIAVKTNKNLMDLMLTYSVYDDTEYRLPVFYICGRNDWQTPSTIVEEYFQRIQAPKKGLYWVEDAGHFALIDNPEGYNAALLKVIEEIQASNEVCI